MTQTAPDAYAEGLPADEARERILRLATPISGDETVPLANALDRVLAHDVNSPIDVPAHDNSAMDGYALRGADLPSIGEATFRIIGRAFAGNAFDESRSQVGAGECVRIMTGAVMPSGCDTVVPQEMALSANATEMMLPAGVVQAGEHRRLRGEDLAQGKSALRAGRRLRPADLGLLASLGFATVAVKPRLKVAFFSTGDELCLPGEVLRPGCIYDSNSSTIEAMLQRLGCEPLGLGLVPDHRQALRAALEQACELGAHAIITSGGVSVGEADHVREVMAQMGSVNFWKLLMRPGRPMAYGRIHSGAASALLFGLPGNPVAAMVTFYFFARPALLHMMGQMPESSPMLRARSVAAIRKKPGRTEYQRAIVQTAADGKPEVRLTGAQGAGILRSMSEANGIVVLDHDQASVAAGDEVNVVMFDGLI